MSDTKFRRPADKPHLLKPLSSNLPNLKCGKPPNDTEDPHLNRSVSSSMSCIKLGKTTDDCQLYKSGRTCHICYCLTSS